MSIVEKIFPWIHRNKRVEASPMRALFTKYGPCRAKMYKHKKQEYLLLISEMFDSSKEQMLYIYANKHVEHEGLCACNDQVDVALKMMIEAQGAIIYSTQNELDMFKCLEKLGVKAVQKSNAQGAAPLAQKKGKKCENEYDVVREIITQEGISKLRLICADPGLALHLQRESIELVEWCSFIAFDYGQGGV
jgi:hypothetical protein